MPTPEEMLTDPYGVLMRHITKFEVSRAIANKYLAANNDVFKTQDFFRDFQEIGRRALLAFPYKLEPSAFQFVAGFPIPEILEGSKAARMPSTFTWVTLPNGDKETLGFLLHDRGSEQIQATVFACSDTYEQDFSKAAPSENAKKLKDLAGGQVLIYIPNISLDRSTGSIRFPGPSYKEYRITGKPDFSINISWAEKTAHRELFQNLTNLLTVSVFTLGRMTDKKRGSEIIVTSEKRQERGLANFSVKSGHVPQRRPSPIHVDKVNIKPEPKDEADHESDSATRRTLSEPHHVTGYIQRIPEKVVTVKRQDGVEYSYTRKARVTEVSDYVRGAKDREDVPPPKMRPIRAARVKLGIPSGGG